MRHLGKPHADLQELLPWEYAKYCRELGEFLYFDAKKVLESCLAALTTSFPQPSGTPAPAWTVAMMPYNNPILTATLSLRPTERSFPECLETLLNQPASPDDERSTRRTGPVATRSNRSLEEQAKVEEGIVVISS